MGGENSRETGEHQAGAWATAPPDGCKASVDLGQVLVQDFSPPQSTPLTIPARSPARFHTAFYDQTTFKISYLSWWTKGHCSGSDI